MLALLFAPTVAFGSTPATPEFCGCGPVRNFELMPDDPNVLPRDVIQLLKDVLPTPNGCNECPPHRHAAYVSPEDICMMQANGTLVGFPKLTEQPDATADACASVLAEDHVESMAWHIKVCVANDDLAWMWKQGHCHDEDGTPYLTRDGMMVCMNWAEMTQCAFAALNGGYCCGGRFPCGPPRDGGPPTVKCGKTLELCVYLQPGYVSDDYSY
jgi:hypothetical protein